MKQSGHGHIFEHLELSGTKIMMEGTIVCQLYMGRNRETNNDL